MSRGHGGCVVDTTGTEVSCFYNRHVAEDEDGANVKPPARKPFNARKLARPRTVSITFEKIKWLSAALVRKARELLLVDARVFPERRLSQTPVLAKSVGVAFRVALGLIREGL